MSPVHGERTQRSDQIVRLGRWFAGKAGVAAVASCPYHGDRVPALVPAPVYQPPRARRASRRVTDRMVADWRLVVDLLDGEGFVDGGRLGYHGMSMVSAVWLPLAGGLDGECVAL